MLSRSQIDRLYRLYGRGVNRSNFETLAEAYFRMVNEGITLTDALGGINVRRIGELGVSLGFLTRREGVYVPLGIKYHVVLTRGNTQIEYDIWAPLWATDNQALYVGRIISGIRSGGSFNIDKIPNVTFQNRSSYTLLVGNTQYEATFIYQWDESGVCYLRRQRGGRECNTGLRLRRRTFIRRCIWNYGRRYYPPGRIELCKVIKRRLVVPTPPWAIPERLVKNAVAKIQRFIPASSDAIRLAIYAYQRMAEYNDSIYVASRVTADATNTDPNLVRRLLIHYRLVGNVDAAGIPRRGNRIYDPLGDRVCYAINTKPYISKNGKETVVEARFCVWLPVYVIRPDASEPADYMFSNVLQVASNLLDCIPAGPSQSMIIGITKAWGLDQLFTSIENQVTRANINEYLRRGADFGDIWREAGNIYENYNITRKVTLADYLEERRRELMRRLFLHNRDSFQIAITHGTKIHRYDGIFRYQWDGDIICYFRVEGLERPNEPEYTSCTTGTTWICMSGGFELCSWNFDEMLRLDNVELNRDTLC